MQPIKDLLSQAMRRYGLNLEITAAHICEIASQTGQGKFQALSFREGVLTVNVINAVQATELQIQKQQLIKEINQKIGREVILKIKFK
jgi:predicted nucleic acid-binding Zn ribbon protein